MIWQFLALLLTHWIADFVLQTHWQASNKSKDNIALSKHVATYTFCLFVASAALMPTGFAFLWFTMANGILHWITDYFTSRWSSKLYAKQDWHNFFVVIGFDQLVHQTTLAATLWLAVTYG